MKANFGAFMRKLLAKDIDKRLQGLLAECRKAKKLTQVELADVLGKPQSYVSKYETGERKLTVGDFVIVCAAMGYDPKAVIGRL